MIFDQWYRWVRKRTLSRSVYLTPRPLSLDPHKRNGDVHGAGVNAFGPKRERRRPENRSSEWGVPFSRVLGAILLLSYTSAVVFIGCKNDSALSSSSRAVDNRVYGQTTREPSLRPTKKDRSPKNHLSELNAQPSPTTTQRASGSPVHTNDKSGEPAERERDLKTELNKIVGNPIDCLIARDHNNAPDAIEVSVEAYVTINGIVSRCSVSSPFLNDIELDCVKKRIDNGRFVSPVSEAPRVIRTSIVLRQVEPKTP